MSTYLLLILLFLTTLLVYLKVFLPLTYWRNHKVFQINPLFHFLKVFLCLTNESIQDVFRSMYNKNKHRRYFGTYIFLRPALFVNDINLIKKMTIKDFDYFHDRVNFLNNSNDRLFGSNLMALNGKKWREMRYVLSPAFTPSKMKAMYPLMCNTARIFNKQLEENVGENNVLEMKTKDLFETYTNDIVVNCYFGIELNSLQETEENSFIQVGKIFMRPKVWTLVKGILFLFIPSFFRKKLVFPLDIPNIFIETIMKAIDQREKSKIYRPDLIHLLIEAKKGRLKHDTNENLYETGFATVKEHKLIQNSKTELELTNDVMAAQAGLMFFAGLSTNSTFLQFFAYELALHPEIQRKLQQEIDAEFIKSNIEEISFNSLVKMKYLDQTVCEVLRKWSTAYLVARVCTKDYVIEPENSGEERIVVEKGNILMIPINALHYDPEFFPEPEKFDPERFSDENKAKNVSGSFIPFGSGPRNCIGARFGLLLAKAQIVNLLHKFDIVQTEKTHIPVKLANRLLTECKDVWLGFQKRY